MGKKILVDCELEWAKVFPGNIDNGDNAPDDVKAKIKEGGGKYSVTLIMDKESAANLKAQGIPHKAMSASLWGTTEDGRVTYKTHRYNYNSKLNEENGPPRVFYQDADGNYSAWDFEGDGALGNGTKARVRLDLWSKNNKSIVTLDALRVLELVPYEDGGSVNSDEDYF